jgi:hypothetical protein
LHLLSQTQPSRLRVVLALCGTLYARKSVNCKLIVVTSPFTHLPSGKGFSPKVEEVQRPDNNICRSGYDVISRKISKQPCFPISLPSMPSGAMTSFCIWQLSSIR